MSSTLSRFVPAFQPPSSDLIKKFIDHVASIDRLLVLTGAGVSTESGIPDYRSKGIGLFERSNQRPITIQEFVSTESARKRYWSRNFLAWPNFSSAQCNAAHRAIASWERSNKFVWLITQNVDGLHAKAGSNLLTELHGCGLRVKCMDCGDLTKREDHQSRMEKLNAEWMKEHIAGEIRPDGDVDLPEGAHEGFVIPSCQKCGGILKTDVVFFGDNVGRDDVDLCYEKVEQCTGVLVLGSSLTVMSGFRFAYHASLMGKPVLIVNIGPTRADTFAEMRISAPVTEIVTKL
ncbi:NAD-dependent protein deacetylase [Trichostrongylus colubriformis]|uniref:NAD-dependent protein deacylase n=1 Tax=Trichostrongylus colubriformis TaxID=6319 RepID=A0AAN8F5Z7_TRICO